MNNNKNGKFFNLDYNLIIFGDVYLKPLPINRIESTTTKSVDRHESLSLRQSQQ